MPRCRISCTVACAIVRCQDYTGLKTQVLQGGNGAPESGGRSESEDSAPDGSGKGKGPWNKPVLQGGNGAPESGGRSESEDSAPDGSGKGKGPWNKPTQVLQGGNGAPESGGRSESEDSAPDGSGKGKGPWNKPVSYTGLKTQVLQGGNGAPESGGRSESEDSAPDGSGKGKGPWNKPVEVEPPPPPPPVEEPPRREVKPAAYVAPAQRNRPVEPLRRHQAKHAPDIHNDDTFPVLGAGPGAKRGGWSTAGASPAPAHHARQPLALGNRFTTLQDDS
ncbi:protein CDV3 homolog [Ostrinia nubilalis]|uniref:protein CDV3 homolog n=1 Tax=Ostrinia nubilalis TaxID=29057 RepID=UPI0030825FD5